jgi:hypothetical protein
VVLGDCEGARNLALHLVDIHRELELTECLHCRAVEDGDALRSQAHAPHLAVSNADPQSVIQKVELHLEGAGTGMDQPCCEAAR